MSNKAKQSLKDQQREELISLKKAQKEIGQRTETPKTYQINGQEYSQDFLTIDKIIRLAKALSGFDFTKVTNYIDAITMLQKAGKIQAFFEVVLDGPKTDFTKAPAFILMRVVMDFFSLNQLFELMGEFASGMGLLQTAEGLLIGMKQLPPSQTGISPNTGQSEET